MGLSILLAAFVVVSEARTSWLQSRVFSRLAADVTWTVQREACRQPMPVLAGPYDRRLGHERLPELRASLPKRGYVVARQACPSPALARLAAWGIAPPYEEKDVAALRILDVGHREIYQAPLERLRFCDYDSIPELLVHSLLFVENRQLLDEDRERLNPAFEWDRLIRAVGQYAVDQIVDTGKVSGGSTLATQLEKFRHSPEGRTTNASDKLRQMVAASLRAYRDGPDTRRARREIVLDYLNSMPLGAAPGAGEVLGLGAGMWVWFGKEPEDLIADLGLPEDETHLHVKAETYKQALALVLATRRPSEYLLVDRGLLENRLQVYLNLLETEGLLAPALAQAARAIPLRFRTSAPEREVVSFSERKATNAVRTELLDLLDVPTLHAFDRYDLRVETSLDGAVQDGVTQTFKQLSERDFLGRNGFYGERLLGMGGGHSKYVVYSFSLYESTPYGNRLRVHADNLDKPLDINRDVKLEMGSTAKLRTVASYLMVIADLYERHRNDSAKELRRAERQALDPISIWCLRALRHRPEATLENILNASLERSFSVDPEEVFFTGGGIHRFVNYDEEMEGELPLRSAFRHSVNLIHIRLMREIVQYYTAELGFDEKAILANRRHPDRKELLDSSVDQESRRKLWALHTKYRDLSYEDAARKLCGRGWRGIRRLAKFVMSIRPDVEKSELLETARRLYPKMTPQQERSLERLHRRYAGRPLRSDGGASWLGCNPLELWIVRDLEDHPEAGWSDLVERSAQTRRQAYAWIHNRAGRENQDDRIRTELERRAFETIHASWKTLGYPFETLVPSLATSIGSSADRPRALAELAGIIQNDGVRKPFRCVEKLHFAEGTPYETVFVPDTDSGTRVMPREVARALKSLMQEVVETGTGRRARGVLRTPDGKRIPIGGKTGSGDNRFETFDEEGTVLTSRAINRTASFVFWIGDRFFGIVSAFVQGERAEKYHFTSALALQTFRVLAPVIHPLVTSDEPAPYQAASLPPPALRTGARAQDDTWLPITVASPGSR